MTDYIISDLHLEHYNIIRYCNRPFKSSEEMDSILVENWNNTVKEDDVVIFLGDLTINRAGFKRHLRSLSGIKRLVKGNHDRLSEDNLPRLFVETIDGVEIMFIHNPNDVPADYTGWIVHGHVHDKAPFFDAANKRFNVSVEAIGYTPIKLSKIIELIKASQTETNQIGAIA